MGCFRRLASLLVSLECLRICCTAVGAVVGGETAAAAEFPHMALLGRPCTAVQQPQPSGGLVAGRPDCDAGNEWFCGGSLISNRFVLTAAHCAHTAMPNPPTVVRLGEHDLADRSAGNRRQDYAIDAIVQHPEYNGIQTYNDIALVRLERTVTFGPAIQPACLWTQDTLPAGVLSLIATGWGKLGHFEEPATVLHRVQIPVVPNAQCNRLLYRNRRLRNGILSTQLCAGDPLGGKDTCEGDSGGPLQFLSEHGESDDLGRAAAGLCRYQLVGVTSNGGICGTANRPGIYTRVSSYIDWIERVVWGEG